MSEDGQDKEGIKERGISSKENLRKDAGTPGSPSANTPKETSNEKGLTFGCAKPR